MKYIGNGNSRIFFKSIKLFVVVLLLNKTMPHAEERDDKKSPFIGKTLTLVTPFGGLGYAYADSWRDEYGYKWLFAESSMFVVGVGLATMSSYYGNQEGESSSHLFIEPNIYGYASLPFLLFWTIYRIYQVEDVGRIIEIKNNALALTINF